MMYLFLIGCTIITIFGNLGIIISIAHFKQLHSPTNFLILSMAATDFLVGLIIMPYSTVRSIENCWLFGNLFCKIHYSFDLMLSVISIFHLCSIAVDRFYAVCDPLHYSTRITMSVIRKLLLFCWLVPAIFAFGVVISDSHVSGIEGYEILVSCFSLCPITFNKLWGVIMFIACFFAPGSVMVGIYIKIFVVSRRHARIINNLSGNASDEKRTQLSKKTDRKAAKTLGIVMGVFLSCWMPVFITILIDPFLEFSTPEVLFDALNWLGYINSTCNPLIYGFFYPWFRKALKYILSGKIFDPHSRTASLLK
ncbi:trace amine-associated receptor 3-like [Rhinatrema bivittatum]|uniref:trace amine-associated receptor 3-like n=1 Tax=Rhinatrema bivittatum TaxID=194408 RepID=UPI00112D5A36|nr:trace amine-associated receptor 3-like [Rhinatrema bivittatum]